MKRLIPLVLLVLLYSCSAKKSVFNQKMASHAAAVDTSYVEDPDTGEIQMIITKKSDQRKRGKINRIPPAKSGDTIYSEDPETGGLEMIIIE